MKGTKMENNIKTADLYEASFYHLNSCKIQSIECMQINGKLTCEIAFVGDNLTFLQGTYFQGKAVVNLFGFRRAYQQINSFVNQAKREYKKQQKNGGEE